MRTWRALLVIGLVLSARVARADVSDYIGRSIASVKIEIEGRETTDPKLLTVVETHAGRPLSMDEVRDSVTHLFSLGRFENVEVHAERAGAGVALRYALDPVHPVSKIEFSGPVDAAGIDVGQLRRAVVERFGVSPPVGRVDEIARLIRDELHQRGYLHASVRPHADLEHAPDRATLVFALEPGERTRVGTITIVGTPSVTQPELLEEMGLTTGVPWQREALSRRIESYVAKRRTKGFYEASVVPTVELADNDRIANITLTVAPGPHVRVVFAGDPLPADTHDDLVPVEREGSVDEDLLEDSSNRIEEYLRAQGYRDAAAPHIRAESNGELLITFTVKKGAQYRVSRVEISGNASVPLADFGSGLRVRDGQPFSATSLDADLSGIETLYHRRGFAAAKAEAALEPQGPPAAGQVLMLVRITIREGVRTVVSSVRIQGNQAVAEATLRPHVGLRAGAPFFQPQIAIDRDALQLQYANLGYPSAAVDASPGLSADGSQAAVVYTIREGQRIFVGHVLIVGNLRTRTETIERELRFKAGDPLGLEAVSESQRRLAALGLFRRTRITELRQSDETTRDVLVTVEEAPVTTIGYGGGFEAVQVIGQTSQGTAAQTEIDFAPSAFVEVTRRNLFGKNRSVNLFGRVSPYFNTADGITPVGGSGRFGFTEYRLLGSFREPRVLNTGADASLTAVIEQQHRASFNFSRKSFIAEVGRHLAHGISINGSYQIQKTRLFDEQFDNASDKLLADQLFPQFLLSSFSTSIARDTRDDVADPGAGGYLSANGQLAARSIGSEVGFAKTFFTAQAFRTLPHTRHIVFAVNGRVGLATAFPRPAVCTASDGTPTSCTVEVLPASERFFAGGDTMRGFALDQLGVPNSTIDKDGFPIGGNALVIANAELRVPVHGGLGVVGFVDTGNVFASTNDINVDEFRTALGFGLRYKSPIGPIRVDLGFKLHRETIAGRLEDLTALHISLGQAF